MPGSGSSFHERAEAAAVRFREQVLQFRAGEHAHHLCKVAAERGANFVLPASFEALKLRAGRGKGVHWCRTTSNMLASQALCFNLFAPLSQDLALAAEVLAPFVPGLVHVRSIELEYTPAFDVFRDQVGLAGVDCDVLIEFEAEPGVLGVLVIETKFVEESFSACKHRARGDCPADVRIQRDFSGCRYASKNEFAYWQRSAETGSLRLQLVEQPGCPFEGPLWQLWVNHTLAHVEASRRGAKRALFAVCAPDLNDSLQARARVAEFSQHAADPASVVFIALEDLLERVHAVAETREGWREWATLLSRRYLVGARPSLPPGSAITAGHKRTLAWMMTPDFDEVVARHASATGDRASIYFRPTADGLVRVALHPKAPCILGFRTHAGELGHCLSPQQALPTEDEIRARMSAFEAWMPTVKRASAEERAVAAWLRRSLSDRLWLPELGAGWALLHHEWRFAGARKKSDILAVQVETGRLGIVELKWSAAQLPLARAQVENYADIWQHDAVELAPFFGDLLRALGRAYGNELAARAVVTTQRAALFVGAPDPEQRIRVLPHG
ncbi:MAG TPA: hypothetical protein VJV78_10385 [Polyangiales bacterium]|nr:hypothetical protein [Polyangiales bacterium]